MMIKMFLDKAMDNLSAAQMCYDHHFFDAAVNRAYYGAFHAATALLAQQGIKRTRLGHDWVQAEFNGELIKRKKLIPGKFKSYLSSLQAIRDEADYDADHVPGKKAYRQIQRANELFDAIKRVIK